MSSVIEVIKESTSVPSKIEKIITPIFNDFHNENQSFFVSDICFYFGLNGSQCDNAIVNNLFKSMSNNIDFKESAALYFKLFFYNDDGLISEVVIITIYEIVTIGFKKKCGFLIKFATGNYKDISSDANTYELLDFVSALKEALALSKNEIFINFKELN